MCDNDRAKGEQLQGMSGPHSSSFILICRSRHVDCSCWLPLTFAGSFS